MNCIPIKNCFWASCAHRHSDISRNIHFLELKYLLPFFSCGNRLGNVLEWIKTCERQTALDYTLDSNFEPSRRLLCLPSSVHIIFFRVFGNYWTTRRWQCHSHDKFALDSVWCVSSDHTRHAIGLSALSHIQHTAHTRQPCEPQKKIFSSVRSFAARHNHLWMCCHFQFLVDIGKYQLQIARGTPQI